MLPGYNALVHAAKHTSTAILQNQYRSRIMFQCHRVGVILSLILSDRQHAVKAAAAVE